VGVGVCGVVLLGAAAATPGGWAATPKSTINPSIAIIQDRNYAFHKQLSGDPNIIFADNTIYLKKYFV
jgi:hypothetical protein